MVCWLRRIRRSDHEIWVFKNWTCVGPWKIQILSWYANCLDPYTIKNYPLRDFWQCLDLEDLMVELRDDFLQNHSILGPSKNSNVLWILKLTRPIYHCDLLIKRFPTVLRFWKYDGWISNYDFVQINYVQVPWKNSKFLLILKFAGSRYHSDLFTERFSRALWF